MILRLYTSDIYEYSKDGYRDNNTPLNMDGVLASISFSTSETSGTATVYKIDREKLNAGTFSESYFDVKNLTSVSGKLYYIGESYTDYNLYRYKIVAGAETYWSELFCVNEAVATTVIKTMNGGVLKVYNYDYFEYSEDGYFADNTELIIDGIIPDIFFDSELTISSITTGLYKMNEDILRGKVISERKVKDVPMSNVNSTVYHDSLYYSKSGTFRYIFTVSPTVGDDVNFWSELFCIDLVDYGEGIGAMIIEDTNIIG